MNQEVLQKMIKKTQDLMVAPTCCDELKSVASNWLKCVETDNFDEVTNEYFQELEEDIMTLESLIEFASSEEGKQYFEIEKANEIVEHAKEIKAKGAIYCDCPACAIVEELLKLKEIG